MVGSDVAVAVAVAVGAEVAVDVGTAVPVGADGEAPSARIFTLATGPNKLFCYAQQAPSGMFFLLELVLDPASQQLAMTLRTDRPGPGADMVAMIVLACLT